MTKAVVILHTMMGGHQGLGVWAFSSLPRIGGDIVYSIQEDFDKDDSDYADEPGRLGKRLRGYKVIDVLYTRAKPVKRMGNL